MSSNNKSISGLSAEQEQQLVRELAELEPLQSSMEQPSALTDSIEIVNHGQIGRMLMPPGWAEIEYESPQGIGTRSSRLFQPIGDESARMCLFYRGLPISESDGAAFAAVLARGPHELDEAEIKAVAEVLGSKADPDHFKFDLCRVEDFRGRNVLTIKGRYRTTEDRVLELFIDADGSGRFVQQLYFQAPKNDYERFEKAAKASLKTMEWRVSSIR